MISRLAACAILLCTALAGVACGSAFHQEDENAVQPAADRGTTVRVENNNWSDMRIYIVRSGIRTRLGYVSSMTEASLDVSDTMVGGAGEVRLMAAPIGSLQRFYSDPLHVSPGQVVEWRLENTLPLSSVRIW